MALAQAPYQFEQPYDWGRGAARVMNAMNAAAQQRSEARRNRLLQEAEQARAAQLGGYLQQADGNSAMMREFAEQEMAAGNRQLADELFGAAGDAYSRETQEREEQRLQAAALVAGDQWRQEQDLRERRLAHETKPERPGYARITALRDGRGYLHYVPEDPTLGLDSIPTDIEMRRSGLTVNVGGDPNPAQEFALDQSVALARRAIEGYSLSPAQQRILNAALPHIHQFDPELAELTAEVIGAPAAAAAEATAPDPDEEPAVVPRPPTRGTQPRNRARDLRRRGMEAAGM